MSNVDIPSGAFLGGDFVGVAWSLISCKNWKDE